MEIIREGKQTAAEAGAEAEAVEEPFTLLTGLLPFLSSPGPLSRDELPTMAWALLCQLDMSRDQTDGGCSAELWSF